MHWDSLSTNYSCIFLNSFLYFHIITFIIKKCTQEKEKTQDYKVLRFKRKKRREKEERYDEEHVDNQRRNDEREGNVGVSRLNPLIRSDPRSKN